MRKSREDMARKAYSKMSLDEKQHIYETVGKNQWKEENVYKKMFGFLHLRADFFEANRKQYFIDRDKALVESTHGAQPLAIVS